MIRRGSSARAAARTGVGCAAAAVAAVVLAIAVAACGGSGPPKPGPTLSAYLSAWGSGNWTAMRRQVLDPPADFRAVNADTFSALGVTKATFTAGPVRVTHSSGHETASAQVAAHYALPDVGAWSPTTTVHLVVRKGAWHVQWSPSTIDPQLHAGEKIEVTRQWPTRAPILGAGGVSLTSSGSEVQVGLDGSHIKSDSAIRTDLLAAGATDAEISNALAAAKAHPVQFETVFTVSRARFNQLRVQSGPDNVYNVPGTVFQPATQTGAITQQLSAHLIGTVGPITAAELKQLGSPYTASSIVGQSGLEQSEERTLAGTPTTQINVEDSGGNPIARLATYTGHPGHAVRTSIDPKVQRAAESALDSSGHSFISMAAIQASTGKVLAVVSNPTSAENTALEGTYPPGSTFKVITSTALFRKGLTPDSPASCPSTINVDGESFHNAGDEAPTPTITQAFIESCNTAFIGLSMAHLSPPDFPAAASVYGLNGSPHLGVSAYYANVLKPKSQTAQAGDTIGQGNVTFSPLGMAKVAAALDSGVVRQPTLVQGLAANAKAPTSKVPASIVAYFKPMMLGVVQSGTAAGTGLPSGTYAKTGTAEYGPRANLIDGWLMGYNGDIAFAIVTQNTGGADGGPVDGPIIAKFFAALGQ